MKDGRSRTAPRAAQAATQRSETRTGPQILVALDDEGWSALLGADPEPLVRQAVFAAADALDLPPDVQTELSVTLSGDATVQALNAEWRGKDKPTNILSFPMLPLKPGDAPGPLLGDLILALETCGREAAEENKAPADHFRHLLVHGMLHLVGYDHEADDEADAMERLEVEILAGIGIPDPYGADDAALNDEHRQERVRR